MVCCVNELLMKFCKKSKEGAAHLKSRKLIVEDGGEAKLSCDQVSTDLIVRESVRVFPTVDVPRVVILKHQRRGDCCR
jgi:hypothetical protein